MTLLQSVAAAQVTVFRRVAAVQARGLKLLARIDHAAGAAAIGTTPASVLAGPATAATAP